MARKNNTVIIRLNDIDLAIIKKKAELLQISVSEYLRTSGTQRKVAGYSNSDMYIQNDIQIDGQISIQDLQEVQPKQTEKAKKAGKTAKIAGKTTPKKGGKNNGN